MYSFPLYYPVMINDQMGMPFQCCFFQGTQSLTYPFVSSYKQLISSTIAVNFGFLYTLTGRMIFLLFVGIMSYSLSIFGKVAMAYLFLVGIFHAVLMCIFPRFSEYVRQKDFYGSKSQK